MTDRLTVSGLLLLALAALIWAVDPTTVSYQGNLTLSPDARQRGDLVVLSGNVLVPAGARIDGALAMLCCNVIVDGALAGDLYLASGNVRLGPRARVGGAIDTIAANADIDPRAVVEGRQAGPGLWLVLFRAIALAPALALGGALLIIAGWRRARRQGRTQLLGATGN